MNERLVEDWLNKASERSFQAPFAQALLAEGMHVLRVGHSSHEHGKDIIAIDEKGKIHAYQLKDGDLSLKQYEEGFAQVTALVETQVEHPAISGQPKHQPWLVISGQLSIPAADRIRVHNLNWKKRRYTQIKVMTGMQLLAKFAKMAANFWPQKPDETRSLLSLYLADGKGVLDRSSFAKLITSVVMTEVESPKTEISRRLAAANLFTSYALSPFYNESNSWEVVQGWTITAAHIAWAADKVGLNKKTWLPTFRLAVESALTALDSLVNEALKPTVLNSLIFYELDEITRARCTICSGAIAIRLLLALKNREEWEMESLAKQIIVELFKSNRLLLWGDSSVPFFLATMWAVDETRGDQLSDGILLSLLSAVCVTCCNSNPMKLAPPYKSADDAISKTFTSLFEEKDSTATQQYASASFSLGPLVTLTTRRLWRNQLASLWSLITKLDAVQLVPDEPRDLLLWDWGHISGSNQSRRFAAPQSWAELLKEARRNEDNALPTTLKEHLDFELLFLLCFPHRLVYPLVKHLDVVIHDL